jgi:hypothetical protein
MRIITAAALRKNLTSGLRRIGFRVRLTMATYQRVKLNAESSENAPATSSIAWLS